jgi:hypothetical protein
LEARVVELLELRKPVYSRAPHRIEADGTVQEVVTRIAALLKGQER